MSKNTYKTLLKFFMSRNFRTYYYIIRNINPHKNYYNNKIAYNQCNNNKELLFNKILVNSYLNCP
jgi:hypothetical protein